MYVPCDCPKTTREALAKIATQDKVSATWMRAACEPISLQTQIVLGREAAASFPTRALRAAETHAAHADKLRAMLPTLPA